MLCTLLHSGAVSCHSWLLLPEKGERGGRGMRGHGAWLSSYTCSNSFSAGKGGGRGVPLINDTTQLPDNQNYTA